MDPTLLNGIFALVGTLAGTFAGIATGTKLTNYRLEQLEKKVDKHNNLVERTYRLEEDKKYFEEDVRDIKNRLAAIEQSA